MPADHSDAFVLFGERGDLAQKKIFALHLTQRDGQDNQPGRTLLAARLAPCRLGALHTLRSTNRLIRRDSRLPKERP